MTKSRNWFVCALAFAAAFSLTLSGASARPMAFKIGPNVDVSNEPGPQFETAIAINPSNPLQIVATSIDVQIGAPGHIRAYSSSDGGATWGSTLLPLPPATLNTDFALAADPSVAWDALGNAYLCHFVWWISLSVGGVLGSAVMVHRSSDGGRTWTATIFGFQPGSDGLVDKPWIAVDTSLASPFRDTIYVAWSLDPFWPAAPQAHGEAPLTLLLSRSIDHGATFSSPILPIGHTGSGVALPLGVDPFVGPDGTLYVAWKDPANEEVAMTASSDGGLTFGPKVTIGPAPSTQFVPIPAEPHALFQPTGLGELGAFPYPACGVDSSTGPNRGTLYCSWMDETASDGTDIFVAHSTDRGQTWSPRVRVNDDPTGVANDQFAQWLSVDPMDGSVSVSWYDTRNDPTHLSTDVFYTRSTDGGLTFSPNVKVTTAPTNEACETCGNRFYGDYEGIAAFGGVVHLIWTDRRESVAALEEEVFTATITVKSS